MEQLTHDQKSGGEKRYDEILQGPRCQAYMAGDVLVTCENAHLDLVSYVLACHLSYQLRSIFVHIHSSVQIFHLHHSSLGRADINRSLHLLVVQSWFVCLHCCVNPLLLSELSPTIGQTCGLSWLPSFFSSVSQQTTIFTSSHLQPPKNYNGTFWQA